ncbi:hypothetical protein [Streptomyces avermitilis]|uniref:Uncharacterized protein n=1 Tax=Streptomyces avermitilis TaxID=33903 RepID=A0A4D4MA52_STRAX|nr:hypothetical protein [Streptomyces avermitilis]GDY68790.1 hypothetical protein SAV14893_081830 [Streptomyces avermitilis]
MSDGITWLTDAWRGDAPILFVTFARGISPRDLVVRLGARPGEVLDPITFGEAERLTFNDRESARVARFGECAGWSYAVEQGWPSKAWWAHPDVSAGGVEVLHLTPKPDAPPGSAGTTATAKRSAASTSATPRTRAWRSCSRRSKKPDSSMMA